MHAVHQSLQALGEIRRAQQHQRLVVDMAGTPAGIDLDDADASALRAGVDAEDAGHCHGGRRGTAAMIGGRRLT